MKAPLLEPLGEMIALRVEEEKVSKGGIHLPDNAKNKPDRGKVLAVGEGKITDEGNVLPPRVKVGDVVYFTRHTHHEVEVKNEKYYLVHIDNILAKIND